MTRSHLFPVAALLACAACGSTALTDAVQTVPLGGPASIRAINASGSTMTLVIDSDSAIKAVQVGAISAPVSLSLGSHQIRLVSGTTISAPITVEATLGQSIIAVGRAASTNGITSSVLADTGQIVPSNKSKLRVVHLSPNAGDITIWRTQPDWHTPIQIMIPFNYGDESPYLQSDPGDWEVSITASGSSAPLLTTGAINVPAGQRRTVVLLDSAGIKRFKILDE